MAEKKQKLEGIPDVSKSVIEMIETGIPTKDAVFFESIRPTHGGPIFELHCTDSYDKKSYKADHMGRMWYTPTTLVCLVETKGVQEFMLVPHSNVRFVRPC